MQKIWCHFLIFSDLECGLKVLIKKSYDRTRRVKRRNWKLQEMARDREGMDTDDERQESYINGLNPSFKWTFSSVFLLSKFFICKSQKCINIWHECFRILQFLPAAVMQTKVNCVFIGLFSDKVVHNWYLQQHHLKCLFKKKCGECEVFQVFYQRT